MKHGLRTYRLPLLAAASMVLALVLWIAWSWQGYSERTLDWRRQRAQEPLGHRRGLVLEEIG